MKEVYIFGHKKPDTDTVTSAISLSYLKNKLGLHTKPMILGNINSETEFVLNYFGVKVPEYLDDVKLQIKDLDYYKGCYIDENESIKSTYEYMQKMNITGVPIVDKNLKFKGLLTSKMIGNELINGDFVNINTSYDNLLKVLNGVSILKFDDVIKGNIIAAAFRSTTFLNSSILSSDTIMIVGDRHSIIEAAVTSKIKLLIIVGDLEIKYEHIKMALENKVNIIRTPYDTFHTAKLINLSNFVGNLLTDTRNVSFEENDYYDEFREKSLKLGYNNYPIINNKNTCLGLIRITDIGKLNKKQVILVDHNEMSQSVDGLEEAEVLEIVDHHKLGSITTSMPINFRNMTVGSTNTIVYLMYKENGIDIPEDIAGLMLSGIISDTLKFTSPTTTQYDKDIALDLATISKVDIDSYSAKMFKAGTNLKGKSIEEIIDSDMKVFDVDNKKVAISQIITLNSEELLEIKDQYVTKIEEIKKNRGYDLLLVCITDIIKDGSYIIFDSASKKIVSEAFNCEDLKEGYFFKKCLSRKKQIVPLFTNIIK